MNWKKDRKNVWIIILNQFENSTDSLWSSGFFTFQKIFHFDWWIVKIITTTTTTKKQHELFFGWTKKNRNINKKTQHNNVWINCLKAKNLMRIQSFDMCVCLFSVWSENGAKPLFNFHNEFSMLVTIGVRFNATLICLRGGSSMHVLNTKHSVMNEQTLTTWNLQYNTAYGNLLTLIGLKISSFISFVLICFSS